MPQLRHREPRAGSLLHVVRRPRCRRPARRAPPRTRPARSSASSAERGSGRVDRAWWRLRRARRPSRPRPPGWRRRERPRLSGATLFGGQLPGGAPAWGSPAGGLPEERRKATVLFADLSGYTAVAERMDPEAVKSIIDRALRRLGQEVVRYGGTVDKYIGDNVMARVRRAGRPRGRPRARRPRRPRDAGGDGGDQPGHRRRGRGQLLAAGRDQLRRGAGRPGRRRLHGDRRRGQRRRAAAGGGATRNASPSARSPTGSPAARSSTTSSSRSTLKGKSEPVAAWEAVRVLVAGPATRGARAVGAADRPRGRVGAAPVAVRAGGPREPPAPGHGHRPGRGRQVAPAARAGGADRRARRSSRPSGSGAAPPTAPGSPTGRSARSSAASSRSSTPTTPSCAWAQAPARGRVGRLRRRDRRAARAARRDDRSPARHRAPGRARDGDRRPRARGPAADARPPVLRRALAGRGGEPAPARSSSRSRTSTGPTRACST